LPSPLSSRRILIRSHCRPRACGNSRYLSHHWKGIDAAALGISCLCTGHGRAVDSFPAAHCAAGASAGHTLMLRLVVRHSPRASRCGAYPCSCACVRACACSGTQAAPHPHALPRQRRAACSNVRRQNASARHDTRHATRRVTQRRHDGDVRVSPPTL
jgi:hypothetical protein